MKRFLLILGIALIVFGLYPFIKYVGDFEILSSYGKGFVTGKILMVSIGVVLIFFSMRLKSKETV